MKKEQNTENKKKINAIFISGVNPNKRKTEVYSSVPKAGL